MERDQCELANNMSSSEFMEELRMLQERLGRYDDLIWQYRGLVVTLVTAAIGWAVAQQDAAKADRILQLAVLVPAFIWVQKAVLRVVHWHKFVCRYRVIRDTLAGSGEWFVDPGEIARFDLDNRHGPQPTLAQTARTCLLKIEMLLFYGLLMILASAFRYLAF